jgi:hypothetical protein
MLDIEIIQTESKVIEAVVLSSDFNPYFWAMMAFNLCVFALVKTVNSGYISAITTAAIYNRNLLSYVRDQIDLKRPSAILFTLTYFNALAVLIYQVAQPPKPSYLLLIALILLVGFVLKFFASTAIMGISQIREGIIEHIYNHFIFYQITSLILTVLLIFSHYAPESYRHTVNLTLIILFAILLLVREVHSLSRGIQANISIFYIILYLCTLEIIPLCILFRLAL